MWRPWVHRKEVGWWAHMDRVIMTGGRSAGVETRAAQDKIGHKFASMKPAPAASGMGWRVS